ncbi:MAG: 30S ribosomal protein S8 [Patescibacteria group bacterium]
MTDAARISKLSRRIYEKSKDIKPVFRGRGMVVFSTPSGILTDAEARKANVGGEVLFKIW